MCQDGLITDKARPTSTKTRVMAGSSTMVQQHVVRIDRVDASEICEPSKGQIIDYIKQMLPAMDAVVLSDYENGVMSPEIIETCVSVARAAHKIIVVEFHGSHCVSRVSLLSHQINRRQS